MSSLKEKVSSWYRQFGGRLCSDSDKYYENQNLKIQNFKNHSQLCFLHHLSSRSSSYSCLMNVEGRATREVPWLRERELPLNIHFPFHFTSAPGPPGSHYSASLPLMHGDVQAGGIQVERICSNPRSPSWARLLWKTCFFPGAGAQQAPWPAGPWMTCGWKSLGHTGLLHKREMNFLLKSLCHSSIASITNTVMG